MSMQPPYPPQPPMQPIRPPQLSAQEERTWGMLCHLLAFSGYVGIPFGHIVGPLIAWLVKKDSSAFVNQEGKNSLNFQISCIIYGLLAAILIFVFVGFFLLIALAIFNIVEVIIAAVAASNGRSHQYPLTIRFIS